MFQWLPWTPIETSSRHPGPAVYQIRIVRAQIPVVLNRLLGSDPNGLLAIGETGEFEKRRRRFVRGVSTGSGHSEANLIWIIRQETSANQLFEGAAVEYRFCPAATKAAAVQLEKDALWSYALRFGEVPPFNSSFPGRGARIEGRRRPNPRGAS